MGTVWRAHDHSLGREVAIKEIRQDPGLNEDQRDELRERMIREGRSAARVTHPSVATVYDAIVELSSPWIIMELVEGRSLEHIIDEEGPLPPRLVAEIGSDLLSALRAAHAQGILHRDVKPGNVLLTRTGRVVLTDFGIAKAEGDSNLTKTGMVIGSPGYTAPERARGDYTGPESDLWSLGATLYFAVEGRPAYERATVAATLTALMTEDADPPTQAGPLRQVLDGLLDKDHLARIGPGRAAAMLRSVADTPTSEIPVFPGPEADLDDHDRGGWPQPPRRESAWQEQARHDQVRHSASRQQHPDVPAQRPASHPGAPQAPAAGARRPGHVPPPPAPPIPVAGQPPIDDEGIDPNRTVMVARPARRPLPGYPPPSRHPEPPEPPESHSPNGSAPGLWHPDGPDTHDHDGSSGHDGHLGHLVAPLNPGGPPRRGRVPRDHRPPGGGAGYPADPAAPYGTPERRDEDGLDADLFGMGRGGAPDTGGKPEGGRIGKILLVGVGILALALIVIMVASSL
ncbi:hypothetical protein Ssi02_34020 [Sinosporangium siamense]|uniref:non-specific serine/threonine protein kinase n=2 Tax=Sinosporangium siamense TaxID=1367973 RepID=A0A919RFX8_9ACTN|nr:hypothetical protein Ssi02_34020 [Sinosporangium siamense]